uniref:Uncharacterized protein n=1 Tax=Panagrolaimus sp. PS1159 TaxID=55785 RepID=A0AC35GD99_9BILA
MEEDIIYIGPDDASNDKEEMSMDIFSSSDTEDNTDVKKPNDSNLSKDIFDISDVEVVDEDSDIEIISPKKKARKDSDKENIVDEFDSIEIISPVKKESKPFFIPPDPNKPKQDLSPYLKKPTLSKDKKIRITTPIKKKSAKEEEKKTVKKNLTKALLGTHAVNTDAKPKSGQTKIDSHFKSKTDKKKDVIVERSATPPALRPPVTSREHRTPSPPQRRPGRSASPEYSPLPAHIAEKLKAALESPGFQARKHTALTTVLERAKQQAALKPRSPPTPPRYWDLDVPSREEQIKLGYVIETDSPLIQQNMNVPNLDKFKKSYEEQLKKYQTIEKERENIIVKRQQLEAQLTENNLEMDLLEPGTNIFKLNTVNKRLEYINDEINRCEKSLDDVTKRLATSREAVDSAMKGLQALIAKGS